jgi:phosphoglycolate phosphatase-like HAD superfamily hydrolase
VRRLIGEGSDKLVPQLTGLSADSDRGKAVIARKKAIFKGRYLPGIRSFPRTNELLRTLKNRGIKLALASSAGKDEVADLLRAAGIEDCFDVRTDADDAGRSKPDPDVVCAALRKLGLPAAHCLMVGDTPYDAEAAARAGVRFIGLRCGGWSDADLQPAIAVYADPAELLARLDSLPLTAESRSSPPRTPSSAAH